jgi:hypothetical protein
MIMTNDLIKWKDIRKISYILSIITIQTIRYSVKRKAMDRYIYFLKIILNLWDGQNQLQTIFAGNYMEH